MRLLSLFILLLGTLSTQAAQARCELQADHPLLDLTHWYGLYFEDTKIGHAMATTQRDEAENVITYRFEMTFKLEQTEETVSQIRHFETTPPHHLIDGRYQTADRAIDYRMDGTTLLLQEGDENRAWRGVERTLCDEEDIALHQFLTTNPAIGDETVTVDIDVEHQALITSTHRLDTVSTRKILGAEHRFQTLTTHSNSEGFSYKATSTYRNGEGINFFLGPIELRVETEEIAQQPNTGVDLFAEFEKPLNQPLTNLDQIDELTFKIQIDDPTNTIDEVIKNTFLQRVTYLDDKTAILTTGNFTAPIDDTETQQYLKPTSAHPADHPRIIALAEDIRATAKAPENKQNLAETLLHFVAGYIENVPESPYAYNTTSVFDILDNRTGDCTEHSQLFITLARALGLPARDATGYVYTGDDSAPSLGGHAWVEIFLDGQWIGLDPTWEETILNRSHVQIENDLVMGLSFEVMEISYRAH